MGSPLDLSKFKKVRTEKNHTVLKHPDGHEIKVVHSALSPKIRKQLESVPHMDEGGEMSGLPEKDRTEGFKQAKQRVEKNERHQTNPKLQQSHVVDKVKHYDGGGPITIDPDKAKSIQDSFRGATHYDEGGPIKKENYMSDGGKPKPTPTPVPQGPNLPGVQEAQESMRKAFHFADGGQPIQGEAQPVTASKLESQYGPEDQVAQQSADVGNPAPIGDAHADLAKAVMNLTQKYATPQQAPPPQQSQQAPPEDKAGLAPSSPSPVPVASPEVASQQIQDQVPQGTLQEQAQANTALANKAEIAGAGNVQQAQSKEADIYGKEAQQMQELHQKYEQIGNQLHHKFDNLSQEVEQGKIDPHQWWDSKSTGSKILTAIGMLFAGAGTGVGGHPEMVGQVIDTAINRDIDAQKHNLQNKHNLLSKYMEMYNSLPQAEAAARLTLSAGVEGLIKQQAAKLGSANAMNMATQANAARRQALLPQMEGLAKGQVMGDVYKDMGKSQSGPQQGGAEQSYQKRMEDMRILNPDLGKSMESKYLPKVGVATVPIPDKLREELTTRTDLSDKLARLEVFARQHQGTVMDRAVVNQGKALAASVQDGYRLAHQQGVFKESEKNFVGSIINADPTSFFAGARTLPGYKEARKLNDDTIKQYYKSYGIKPFQSEGASEGQTATMGGVQYRKVPGGWQKVN